MASNGIVDCWSELNFWRKSFTDTEKSFVFLLLFCFRRIFRANSIAIFLGDSFLYLSFWFLFALLNSVASIFDPDTFNSWATRDQKFYFPSLQFRTQLDPGDFGEGEQSFDRSFCCYCVWVSFFCSLWEKTNISRTRIIQEFAQAQQLHGTYHYLEQN